MLKILLKLCLYVVSFQVGCDRSSALIQICAERGFEAFVSDALTLPLCTASFDACISIAVIHHFSTQVWKDNYTYLRICSKRHCQFSKTNGS